MDETAKSLVAPPDPDDAYCYRVVLRRVGEQWTVETYFTDDDDPSVIKYPDGATAWEAAEAVADGWEAPLEVKV
jgi:hypothetical protein